jgi:hypothetical protein
MVLVITNGQESHLTNLIHTFEPRLTVNEQLIELETKLQVSVVTHFPFNHKLPYGLYKIAHLLDSQDSSNLFFILNIEKFIVQKSFEVEFLTMLESFKSYFSTKIIFAPTEYLLQTFLEKQMTESSIEVSTVDLIRHIKHNIDIISKTKKQLKNSNISSLTLLNLVQDFNKIKYLQLNSFLRYKPNFNINFNQSTLAHKKIKNWEKVFNELNNTEFYRYLK